MNLSFVQVARVFIRLVLRDFDYKEVILARCALLHQRTRQFPKVSHTLCANPVEFDAGLE